VFRKSSPRPLPLPYKILPPLSPLTYYRRNLARTLPVAGALAISVFLVASIITLLNSIDQSILVNYGFFRNFSLLSAQYERDLSPRLRTTTTSTPHVGAVVSSLPYFMIVKTVFGQMPVPVYGVEPPQMAKLAQLCGNHLSEGRWPHVNEPEIVMSRLWARNRNAKIGDSIDVKSDRFPALLGKQKLVGILDGGAPLALTDRTYVLLELPSTLLRTSYIFAPKTPHDRVAMNTDIKQILATPKSHHLNAKEVQFAQFYSFEKLVHDLRQGLGFLYTILAFADGLVIIAVALLSGFLANIYFEQRLAEFGLLSAFGFGRERLARRLIIESGTLVLIGWLAGLALTWLIFRALDLAFMQPRGLILSGLNRIALLYTLPAPILVGLASLGTVLLRLYRLDPIEIMERK
jgi:ABC-type antimicrobial peptide transport system permease subunit